MIEFLMLLSFTAIVTMISLGFLNKAKSYAQNLHGSFGGKLGRSDVDYNALSKHHRQLETTISGHGKYIQGLMLEQKQYKALDSEIMNHMCGIGKNTTAEPDKHDLKQIAYIQQLDFQLKDKASVGEIDTKTYQTMHKQYMADITKLEQQNVGIGSMSPDALKDKHEEYQGKISNLETRINKQLESLANETKTYDTLSSELKNADPSIIQKSTTQKHHDLRHVIPS